MGRRKKPIEEALDEMSNEMNEALDAEQAAAEEETEEPKQEAKEEPEAEAAQAKEEKKPRRRRSPRKPKAPGLSIQNAAEENTEEVSEAVGETTEEVAEELQGTEVDNPPAPQRGRGRSRKPAGEPDFKKDLMAAHTASQKSVDAMAKQWETIKEMTTAITSQLEKSSQAIKGIPESVIEAHPELVKAPAQKSQLISKFAIAASVVAVILSLLSLSLSQSARQAVLSAEVARAAQSMSITKPVAAPAQATIVQPTEKVSQPIAAALPFEKVQKRATRPEVFGPKAPTKFRSRK